MLGRLVAACGAFFALGAAPALAAEAPPAAAEKAPSPSVDPPAASAAAPPAPAPPPKKPRRLVWDKRWPRFRIIEYGSVLAAYEVLAFIEFRMHLSNTPGWRGGILFDDAFRSAFRLHDRSARLAAGNVADTLAIVAEAEPIFASVVPPMIDRFNFDVSWQLVALDFEAQAFAGLSQRSLMFFTRRARPKYEACKENSDYGKCDGPTASFPSGHSSTAFAGAGTSCAHHLHLPLYGGGAPDILACIVTLAAATTVGVARLLGDEHWATDIVVGSSIGFLYGYGLPTLLHYHALIPTVETRHLRAMVVPDVGGDRYGAKIFGRF